MVDAPIVKRIEYQLLNIEDTTLELLDDKGEVKSDVDLPEEEHLKEIKNNIIKFFEEGKREVLVTVLNTLGKELVTDVREGNEV